MTERPTMPNCTAFRGQQRFAAGTLAEVALKLKTIAEGANLNGVLVFDDASGQQLDIDLRGTAEEILHRIEASFELSPEAEALKENSPARPGRPKLGVVAREVTLLPRHWEWLNVQPGGASVALRKLVEEARRSSGDKTKIRQSQEAAYKFISAIAGNEEGFEEATRALFAKDREHFEDSVKSWPADVRKHAAQLAAAAF